jgi:uncharacterized protein (DUF433 family)
LTNFPFLELEDIRACLLFASDEVGHSWIEHRRAWAADAAIG